MKHTKAYIGLVVLIILLLSGALYYVRQDTNPEYFSKNPIEQYKNGTYAINGEQVTLRDGASEKEVSISSALKVKSFTNYFGKELITDLNGDNVNDAAIIITQNNNTGKIEYYMVVVITTTDGYATTNSIFIENDISPEAPVLDDGAISVTYTKNGASVKKSYAINNNVLIEIQKATPLKEE